MYVELWVGFDGPIFACAVRLAPLLANSLNSLVYSFKSLCQRFTKLWTVWSWHHNSSLHVAWTLNPYKYFFLSYSTIHWCNRFICSIYIDMTIQIYMYILHVSEVWSLTPIQTHPSGVLFSRANTVCILHMYLLLQCRHTTCSRSAWLHVCYICTCTYVTPQYKACTSYAMCYSQVYNVSIP